MFDYLFFSFLVITTVLFDDGKKFSLILTDRAGLMIKDNSSYKLVYKKFLNTYVQAKHFLMNFDFQTLRHLLVKIM